MKISDLHLGSFVKQSELVTILINHKEVVNQPQFREKNDIQ
jgi:hypothetical protein